MADWQPIETAPKTPQERVIGYFGGMVDVIRWTEKFAEVYGDTSPGWYYDVLDRRVFPTHWQPLPEPPE